MPKTVAGHPSPVGDTSDLVRLYWASNGLLCGQTGIRSRCDALRTRSTLRIGGRSGTNADWSLSPEADMFRKVSQNSEIDTSKDRVLLTWRCRDQQLSSPNNFELVENDWS